MPYLQMHTFVYNARHEKYCGYNETKYVMDVRR